MVSLRRVRPHTPLHSLQTPDAGPRKENVHRNVLELIPGELEGGEEKLHPKSPGTASSLSLREAQGGDAWRRMRQGGVRAGPRLALCPWGSR